MKKVLIAGLMMLAGVAQAGWDLNKLRQLDAGAFNFYTSRPGPKLAYRCSITSYEIVDGKGYYLVRGADIGVVVGKPMEVLMKQASDYCRSRGQDFHSPLAADNG